MSKFKVGDVVQRKSHSNDITKYLGCGNNGTYTVTDVNSYDGCIQLDGWDDAGKDQYPWYSNNFVLAESDELPPAPESVLYVNAFKWGVKANSLGDVLQVGVGDPNRPNNGWTYTSLDADTALQLCHDLRRMAMSIKKKGKQDEAK